MNDRQGRKCVLEQVDGLTAVDERRIRRQIEESTSDYDREKLQERLAKLTGGVAVVKVGAATETAIRAAMLE